MTQALVRASAWGGRALRLSCAAALMLALGRLAGVAVPPWALAVALSTVAVVVTFGVTRLGSGVFGRPIMAGPPGEPLVAITFDDGPDPVHTRRVLDLFDGTGHKATFFVIGERAARHADVVAEIVRRGHGLGNHSFAHSYGTPFRSPALLAAEIANATSVLERAAGVRPRWFRPPVGLLSPRVVAAASRAGVEIVGWSATARDGVAWTSAAQALRRLSSALHPGAILVLHDGSVGGHAPIASDVLPSLLAALDARGLRSVTLDELLS